MKNIKKFEAFDNENIKGFFYINKLEVLTKIGISSEERKNFQKILIDISVEFLPKGCFTDNFADTICYDQLCQEITHYSKTNEFNLIEAMAYQILKLLKIKYLNNLVKVKVYKKPPIQNLKENVSFEIKA